MGQSLLPPLGSLWVVVSRNLSVATGPPLASGDLLVVTGTDPPWVTLLTGGRTLRLQHWVFGRGTAIRRLG